MPTRFCSEAYSLLLHFLYYYNSLVIYCTCVINIRLKAHLYIQSNAKCTITLCRLSVYTPLFYIYSYSTIKGMLKYEFRVESLLELLLYRGV